MKEVEAHKANLDPNNLVTYIDKFLYHAQEKKDGENLFTGLSLDY